MSSMTCAKLTVFTVAGIVVQIIGLSFFIFGFFPVKPALSGVSGPESYRAPFCNFAENRSELDLNSEKLRFLYQELSGIPPSFDRLVLMVIDGLPAEFVLGKDGQPPQKVLREAMPYTQSLLATGMAIGYHAKAAPPTVTMPRLKAMVSGAVGGFLDVAFNFNTQALLDDNLLGQFFRIGWKMVMLGDETWLKLFPGLFMRHDGISSFFVKDTIQVDQNVSRHLEDELKGDDWNLLILHYLGLDHVGHIGGRNRYYLIHALMPSKLMEMDEVVRMIHLAAIQGCENDQERTLLIVVSDHGMTENGNHGGSSYEETDSLMLFIGLRNNVPDYAAATNKLAFQVDIAPTLALLFGVPIPMNNVGILVSETLESLKDDEQLRALELNSWQLLRLMQVQLPSLSFEGLSCNCFGNEACNGFSDGHRFGIIECSGTREKQLYCLYMNAAVYHGSWKSKRVTKFTTKEDFRKAFDAYRIFLKTASEWLASKTTEKPVSLLGLGVAAMLLSCLVLVSLFLCLYREVYPATKEHPSKLTDRLYLEERFILAVVLILIISMGSSSMVEEEHYIWHFVASTFYVLLLRRAAQLLTFKGQNGDRESQILSILMLLICGRLLRGWHQGGVNWTYLPGITKWLAQSGRDYVKWIQLVSTFLVIGLGLFTLLLKGLKKRGTLVVAFSFLMSGLLVLLHFMKHQDNIFASASYGATLSAQIVYFVLATSMIEAAIILPWFFPLSIKMCLSNNTHSSLDPVVQDKSLLVEISDSLYVTGATYIFCWCLLQLLLQQPINSGPIFLLLMQILAISCLSSKGLQLKEWVEVAALYYMGMAGHFALGNSNTLATIDVAGAFIGISSHSTLLSGILMFIITYASPMLFLLSMVLHVAMKERTRMSIDQNAKSGQLLKLMLGFPCLVSLCINSILLTAYTVVLLLMRNHLFVWSVFSPKYLYVCATTVCTYLGVCIAAATVTYTYWVITLRKRKQVALSKKSS